MIHQAQWVRDRLTRLIDRTLHEFLSNVSCLPVLEADILRALTPDARLELAGDVTTMLMARFGHTNVPPKELRFDKARRAARKHSKPPRGLKAGMTKAEKKLAAAAVAAAPKEVASGEAQSTA